jgi:hypothetical protein
MISVKIKNNINRRANEVQTKYENNAQNYVDSIASYFRGQVIRSMYAPKTGKTYPKTQQNTPHVSSARGEAPAVDTSNLVRSIELRKLSKLVAKVFTNVEYAPYLESNLDRYFMSPQSVAYKNSEKMAKALIKKLKVR